MMMAVHIKTFNFRTTVVSHCLSFSFSHSLTVSHIDSLAGLSVVTQVPSIDIRGISQSVERQTLLIY